MDEMELQLEKKLLETSEKIEQELFGYPDMETLSDEITKKIDRKTALDF